MVWYGIVRIDIQTERIRHVSVRTIKVETKVNIGFLVCQGSWVRKAYNATLMIRHARSLLGKVMRSNITQHCSI